MASVFGSEVAATMPAFDQSVEISVGGSVVCHVGLMQRDILVNGAPWPVAAIGYVCTHPHFRHWKLMRTAMMAAFVRAHQLSCTWALLNTGHEGLYEPFGFHRVENLPTEWMVKELLASRPWPDEAVIDLQGTW